MKEIQLTKGKVAMVDDSDFEIVSKHKWFTVKAKNTDYAACWEGPWRERKFLSLHHLIMGRPAEGMFVDHKDGNGLNNQRSNLRTCTIAQNSANRTAYGTSKYLGVSKTVMKGHTYWRAFIGRKYLGLFKVEDDAARAYNKAAVETYGEFANLNNIPIDIPVLTSVIVAHYDEEVGAIIVQ